VCLGSSFCNVDKFYGFDFVLRLCDTGVSCQDDVVTCDIPFGGFVLFNNLTVHRRFRTILIAYVVACLTLYSAKALQCHIE